MHTPNCREPQLVLSLQLWSDKTETVKDKFLVSPAIPSPPSLHRPLLLSWTGRNYRTGTSVSREFLFTNFAVDEIAEDLIREIEL